MLTTIVLIFIIVCLIAYIVGLIIRAVRVKKACRCGAANGIWLELWDKPINLGISLSSPKLRRWTKSDIIKAFSLLDEGKKL